MNTIRREGKKTGCLMGREVNTDGAEAFKIILAIDFA
jgi:hypothetical protein